MKYIYLLFFVLSSSPLQLFAQANFKPGYVVNLKGDTTKGFIDYKEWNQNPQRVGFKPSAEGAVQQYVPTDVLAFGVDMLDQYRSYTGAITKAAVELRDLSIGIDSSVISGSFFLRTLFTGKNLSFYSYDDNIKTRYFVSEKKGLPVELKRYVYLDIKQTDRIREYNFYVQQLLALAIKYQPGDTKIADDINKVAYKARYLQDVLLRIDGSDGVYKVKRISRSGSRLFIGAGANFVTEAFNGRKTSSSLNGIFNTNTQVNSIAPTITGGVDLYFNRNVGKLLFKLEGSLSANSFKASYKGSTFDGFREIGGEEDFSVTQLSLGVNPQLIYNVYNAENLKFFVGLGVNFGFSKFANHRFYIKNIIDGKVENERDFSLRYRWASNNISSRVGITVKNKIEIYGGYYLPALITNNAGYGIEVSYYRFGINYLFPVK